LQKKNLAKGKEPIQDSKDHIFGIFDKFLEKIIDCSSIYKKEDVVKYEYWK
jgi:hypothetical protein